MKHVLLFISLLAIASEPAASSEPWEVRLALNNDLLANNSVDDDFYTFGNRLEVSYAEMTYRWHENAFTDRKGGFRYDETYLTAGRLLPPRWLGAWCVWVEGGVAHVGEGLLGQSAQNTIHEWIGSDPVRLDYLAGADDYYAHIHAETGRQRILRESWTWGPQIGFSAAFGFRWNALAGLRTIWRPSDRFGIDVTVGGRFAGTELPQLEPHLEDTSMAALVEIDLPWGFVVEWSLNRYGTDREHVSVGWRFGTGKSPRRHGAWIEAGATP